MDDNEDDEVRKLPYPRHGFVCGNAIDRSFESYYVDGDGRYFYLYIENVRLPAKRARGAAVMLTELLNGGAARPCIIPKAYLRENCKPVELLDVPRSLLGLGD
jgi:hypothetical protein